MYNDDFVISNLVLGSTAIQSSAIAVNSVDNQSVSIVVEKTAPSLLSDLVIFELTYTADSTWTTQVGTPLPVCNIASIGDGTTISETAPQVCSCPELEEFCSITNACITDTQTCEFDKSA